MYCPQCGQQQVSDTTRFCSRCGFPLEGIIAVLAGGGTVPTRFVQGKQKPSPRSKGVRQGATLLLSGMLIVPVVAIITYNLADRIGDIITPLAALLCFVGGLFRILYALLMEDSAPEMSFEQLPPQQSMPQFKQPARHAALPPPPANTAAWAPRPVTAEIYQPPSVTENTTRLLDKDESKNR